MSLWLMACCALQSGCGVEQTTVHPTFTGPTSLSKPDMVFEVLPGRMEVSGPVGWHYAGFEPSEHEWQAEALIKAAQVNATLRHVLRYEGFLVHPVQLSQHLYLENDLPQAALESVLTELNVQTYDWWTGTARTEAVATIDLHLFFNEETTASWSGTAQGRATGGASDMTPVIRQAMARALRTLLYSTEFSEAIQSPSSEEEPPTS